MKRYRQMQHGQLSNRAASETIWHVTQEKNRNSKKPAQEPTPTTKNHQKATQSSEDKQTTRSHKIAHAVLWRTKNDGWTFCLGSYTCSRRDYCAKTCRQEKKKTEREEQWRKEEGKKKKATQNRKDKPEPIRRHEDEAAYKQEIKCQVHRHQWTQ